RAGAFGSVYPTEDHERVGFGYLSAFLAVNREGLFVVLPSSSMLAHGPQVIGEVVERRPFAGSVPYLTIDPYCRLVVLARQGRVSQGRARQAEVHGGPRFVGPSANRAKDRDGELQMLARALWVSHLAADRGEIAQGGPFRPSIPDRTEDRQRS